MLSSALPGLFQLGSGLFQSGKKVELDKSLPAGQAEELALRRQRAASQVMPGMSQATDNIRRSTSNAISRSIESGDSSANVLATIAGASGSENAAVGKLATANAGFQQSQQDALSGSLLRKAQTEEARRQEYNQAKSALTEGAAKNIFGGLSSLSSNFIYGKETGLFDRKRGGVAATPGANNLTPTIAPYGTGSVNYGYQGMPTMGRNMMQMQRFGQGPYQPPAPEQDEYSY